VVVCHGGRGRLRLQLDADGDGRISLSELVPVSHAITPPPSKPVGGREVGAMMEELDADRDGFA
jgi:calcium-binding protein CML